MPLLFKGGITDENDDFDGILATIIFAVVFGTALTLFQVFVRHTDFDFEKYATAVGVLLGAGGSGYGIKRLGEKYGNHSGPSVSQE